jgi:hypothetical protein
MSKNSTTKKASLVDSLLSVVWKRVECGRCKGAGVIPCPNIDSDGKALIPCQGCKNSGFIACPICGGSGKI